MTGPSNKEVQLTSGGFERASRAASLMRRLQLTSVFYRHVQDEHGRVACGST